MKRLFIISVLLLASLNTSLSNAYDRVTYIHSNGQGTPVAASDEQGNLEWRAEYYPFGEEFSNTEVRRENDIGYSGKPIDQEIGLIYFGARHYDPQVGRFTSIDPAQATAHNYLSFNRYAYANNNPYKYVDPNGEFPFLIPVAIFIGKEIAAEIASRATGGATDFLSLRRLGTKAGKHVAKISEKFGNKKSAEARAKEIHSALDPRAQRMRTTAVTETEEGTRVVSSSNRRLSPAQREQLGKNEIEGVGNGHAEATGIDAARQAGLNPVGTAASRPICSNCASKLSSEGVKPLSPLKK